VVIGRSINIHSRWPPPGRAGWEAIRYEERSRAAVRDQGRGHHRGHRGGGGAPLPATARYVPALPSRCWPLEASPVRHGHPPAANARAADRAGHGHHVDNVLHVARDRDPQPRPAHAHELLLLPTSTSLAPRLHEQPWEAARDRAAQTLSVECAIDLLAEKMGSTRSSSAAQLAAAGRRRPPARREGVAVPGLCDALRRSTRSPAAAAAHTGDASGAVSAGGGRFGIAMPGDKSVAAIEYSDDGVTVYVAAADPGEGNDSMTSWWRPPGAAAPKVGSAPGHGDTTASGRLGKPRDLHDGGAGRRGAAAPRAMDEKGAHPRRVRRRPPCALRRRRTTLETRRSTGDGQGRRSRSRSSPSRWRGRGQHRHRRVKVVR